jgi:O-acetyl-ADP-ribose deacetylase (regulator of RNase III)
MSVRDPSALIDTIHAGRPAAPGETALEPGTIFRGLKIRASLGSGGMGIAYLASHANLRTPVVVKVFRLSGTDPLAEAHLAARVVSSQVVQVLDAGVENGVPYVIQRYVDGVDLHELLRIHVEANRAIPVSMLVRIGVNVLRGLSSIHVAGVIHRDIKPPNLFLSGAGEAMVGDFGIAVDPHGAARGDLAGTPAFLAPELWTGEPATPRSDLYSAAATLHLLWQREAPFASLDPLELVRLHREATYRPPESSDPVAAYFGACLARMLAKAPGDRPESALGAARMLERVATPAPELRGHHDGVARIGDLVIALEQHDICTARTDVIVSAANERLEMKTGLAGALRTAGGDELHREASVQGPVTMGQVVWTGPGRLACKAVAHAVAAVDGAICIQRAVLRTLFEAERRGFQSISFPALGTGVGGVPHGLSARLTLETLRTFASFAPRHCRSIRIALLAPEAMVAWMTALVALDADAVPT